MRLALTTIFALAIGGFGGYFAGFRAPVASDAMVTCYRR